MKHLFDNPNLYELKCPNCKHTLDIHDIQEYQPNGIRHVINIRLTCKKPECGCEYSTDKEEEESK